ncbi:hypothetical protein KI387_038515 [Taxus chinensis]|uniref:Uncharacterized protein n=1 Tax=Taxus chinensis TaxID=29808 RepID=A0AA38FAV7_TAXCH|nr:hypothetical protein KI387_038515 [Taxus chinensis]
MRTFQSGTVGTKGREPAEPAERENLSQWDKGTRGTRKPKGTSDHAACHRRTGPVRPKFRRIFTALGQMGQRDAWDAKSRSGRRQEEKSTFDP